LPNASYPCNRPLVNAGYAVSTPNRNKILGVVAGSFFSL
jgi:hypothetical protein